MVIKPSGVAYDELTAANMVVTDLFGALVEGNHATSSDTAAHAYVYRHTPDVGGVVHTHSTYATAWAARAQPIPCVLKKDARAAVKAAVMVEDVARTGHIARQAGTPKTIEPQTIDSLYARYQNDYGQSEGNA
jgi:L-ribulose-5-phosphate 4-epimerase